MSDECYRSSIITLMGKSKFKVVKLIAQLIKMSAAESKAIPSPTKTEKTEVLYTIE